MQHLNPESTLKRGDYKIIRPLGQGGFAITYLAIQAGLERQVAIKEFFMKEHCERNPETSQVTMGTEGSRDTVTRFKEKFLKEARNIARLKHPNIIRVIDVFEENDTAYYVMEYADGGSLADKVKAMGYLPEPVATRYILQIASALGYIHEHRMNHLDIKPGNIMLNEEDEPIIIDFGLSKQYDAVTGNQTSTTPVGISEGYAPIEQYNPGGVKDFSPETDIYALGATYYKLLTGVTPPRASDVNENGIPVEPLRQRGISQPIIGTICKAMEGRKKDRTKSIAMFVEGIQSKNEHKVGVTKMEDVDEATVLDVPSKAPEDKKDEKSASKQEPSKDEIAASKQKIMKKSKTMLYIIAPIGLCLVLGALLFGLSGKKSVSFQKDVLRAMQNGDVEAYCEAIKTRAEYISSLSHDELQDYDREIYEWDIDNEAEITKATLIWEEALNNMSAKDKETIKKAKSDAVYITHGRSTRL